jgi:preprotein translocase subunit SecA
MNTQREIIYKQRNVILDNDSIHDDILNMIDSYITETANKFMVNEPKCWDVESVKSALKDFVDTEAFDALNDIEKNKSKKLRNEIIDTLIKSAHEKYEGLNNPEKDQIEKNILLKNVDEKWMNHIDAMDQLKKGISLRSYGQKNPVVEYRMEGMDMFDRMTNLICEDTLKDLFAVLTPQLKHSNTTCTISVICNSTEE